MSDRLTIGPRPPHPPPRRVRLGADAWALLAEALADAELPPPFGVDDGPTLGPAQRAAAIAALRAAGVLAGDGATLLDDLRPAVREGLLLHAQPAAVVDASVGLGTTLRAARYAVGGQLVSGLVREQRPGDDGGLELGPVELGTLLIDDLAADVLRGFGDLAGEPGRAPLRLDAAISLAAVHALADERPDVARAVLRAAELPAPLQQLAAGLRAVARVDVAGADAIRVQLAVRLADGWWTVALERDDVLLQPVGEDELVIAIASALAGALTAGAPR